MTTKPSSPSAVAFGLAHGEAHLQQILALQQRNIEGSAEQLARAADGFVTVEHDLTLLRSMNDAAAHVVAISDEHVVGYALAMLDRFADRIALLEPMFI